LAQPPEPRTGSRSEEKANGKGPGAKGKKSKGDGKKGKPGKYGKGAHALEEDDAYMTPDEAYPYEELAEGEQDGAAEVWSMFGLTEAPAVEAHSPPAGETDVPRRQRPRRTEAPADEAHSPPAGETDVPRRQRPRLTEAPADEVYSPSAGETDFQRQQRQLREYNQKLAKAKLRSRLRALAKRWAHQRARAAGDAAPNELWAEEHDHSLEGSKLEGGDTFEDAHEHRFEGDEGLEPNLERRACDKKEWRNHTAEKEEPALRSSEVKARSWE
jgi:hypothetical protein